jgi:hypothetical protein
MGGMWLAGFVSYQGTASAVPWGFYVFEASGGDIRSPERAFYPSPALRDQRPGFEPPHSRNPSPERATHRKHYGWDRGFWGVGARIGLVTEGQPRERRHNLAQRKALGGQYPSRILASPGGAAYASAHRRAKQIYVAPDGAWGSRACLRSHGWRRGLSYGARFAG